MTAISDLKARAMNPEDDAIFRRVLFWLEGQNWESLEVDQGLVLMAVLATLDIVRHEQREKERHASS